MWKFLGQGLNPHHSSDRSLITRIHKEDSFNSIKKAVGRDPSQKIYKCLIRAQKDTELYVIREIKIKTTVRYYT